MVGLAWHLAARSYALTVVQQSPVEETALALVAAQVLPLKVDRVETMSCSLVSAALWTGVYVASALEAQHNRCRVECPAS